MEDSQSKQIFKYCLIYLIIGVFVILNTFDKSGWVPLFNLIFLVLVGLIGPLGGIIFISKILKDVFNINFEIISLSLMSIYLFAFSMVQIHNQTERKIKYVEREKNRKIQATKNYEDNKDTFLNAIDNLSIATPTKKFYNSFSNQISFTLKDLINTPQGVYSIDTIRREISEAIFHNHVYFLDDGYYKKDTFRLNQILDGNKMKSSTLQIDTMLFNKDFTKVMVFYSYTEPEMIRDNEKGIDVNSNSTLSAASVLIGKRFGNCYFFIRQEISYNDDFNYNSQKVAFVSLAAKNMSISDYQQTFKGYSEEYWNSEKFSRLKKVKNSIIYDDTFPLGKGNSYYPTLRICPLILNKLK